MPEKGTGKSPLIVSIHVYPGKAWAAYERQMPPHHDTIGLTWEGLLATTYFKCRAAIYHAPYTMPVRPALQQLARAGVAIAGTCIRFHSSNSSKSSSLSIRRRSPGSKQHLCRQQRQHRGSVAALGILP
jgi:hypothetical protein